MGFLNKKKLTSHSGFTLIELLIVIAVLGVLATIILVSINPGEQLAKSRDSQRISTIARLARGIDEYLTLRATSTYPAHTSNGWQTGLLVTSGILKIPLGVSQHPTSTSACGGSTAFTNGQKEGHLCYYSSGTDAYIWTVIESKSHEANARAAAITAGETCTNMYLLFAWRASTNEVGYLCSQNSASPVYNTGTVYPL